MYIHRELEAVIKEALLQFPAVMITGPRQAGKSTLLRHVFKNYQYVTLDDPLLRRLATQDPELFLSTYSSPVIIDEIQYAPDIMSYLKLRIDKNRSDYGAYILTGSQLFPLMKGVSESLAGRTAVFQLYPLSWKEIKGEDIFSEKDLVQQMMRGFYPEFLIQPKLNPGYWHSAYLSTYLEKDIRSIRNIQDLGQFQQFLVLLAARAGQLLNLSEIGKECGISQTTVKDWIMLLQATSIIYLLEPFHRNMTKRVVKSPKLFFVDTGLLSYLLRIESPEQLIHSPFAGHLFENMVVMERVKRYAGKGSRAPCYFYRSTNGHEVDLIEDHGTYLDAFEIKFTASPKKEMAQSLERFRAEHPVSRSSLLCLRKDSAPLTAHVDALHWSQAPFSK